MLQKRMNLKLKFLPHGLHFFDNMQFLLDVKYLFCGIGLNCDLEQEICPLKEASGITKIMQSNTV